MSSGDWFWAAPEQSSPQTPPADSAPPPSLITPESSSTQMRRHHFKFCYLPTGQRTTFGKIAQSSTFLLWVYISVQASTPQTKATKQQQQNYKQLLHSIRWALCGTLVSIATTADVFQHVAHLPPPLSPSSLWHNREGSVRERWADNL